MVEQARQGRDAATLEVVMEAAGPLIHSQLEDLGACTGQAHPEVARPSCPPTTAVLQPIVVVV